MVVRTSHYDHSIPISTAPISPRRRLPGPIPPRAPKLKQGTCNTHTLAVYMDQLAEALLEMVGHTTCTLIKEGAIRFFTTFKAQIRKDAPLVDFLHGMKFLLTVTEARGMADGLSDGLQNALYDRVLDPWNLTPSLDPLHVCVGHGWGPNLDEPPTEAIYNRFGQGVDRLSVAILYRKFAMQKLERGFTHPNLMTTDS
jgi:hypothetical protein